MSQDGPQKKQEEEGGGAGGVWEEAQGVPSRGALPRGEEGRRKPDFITRSGRCFPLRGHYVRLHKNTSEIPTPI